MLSHLRFHRRGGPSSNPVSPAVDQQPSPLSNINSPFTPDSASSLDTLPPTLTTSLVPPTLPPITRVTSDESSPPLLDYPFDGHAPSVEQRMPPPGRPLYPHESSFIGGVALENYRRDLRAQKALVTSDNTIVLAVDEQQVRAKPNRSASEQVAEPRSNIPSQGFTKAPPQPSVSSSDSVNIPSKPTGRRPPGFSMNAEQAPLPSSETTSPMEPQKGKRGLPFLKNPMSTLLMRRKLTHNAPEALSLPPKPADSEPTYDPRIKGTRVHDFSAPRRRSIPRNGSPKLAAVPFPSNDHLASMPESKNESTNKPAPSQGVRASNGPEMQSIPPATTSTVRNSSFRDRMRTSTGSTPSDSVLYDNLSNIAEYNGNHGSSSFTRGNPSTRTTRSNKLSLSEVSSKDTLSSLPRHMKSTSSRFSFDMIGAAKQEKIMEERHRQRQLERGEPGNNEQRDSRFDGFDEDAFDYDAMMDDDGLEERIPGVNADFDQDEYLEETPFVQNDEYDTHDTLENDHENFAGFVFQRSDPASSLASPNTPGQMSTPRDAHGQPIGSALTKDTPTTASFPLSGRSNIGDMDPAFVRQFSGLGIKSLEQNTAMKSYTVAPDSLQKDEQNFDDGVTGYEDEFAEDLAAGIDPNAEPFDESIFDNDDTDQFGRPVPGAFAHAQSLRKAASQSKKQESEMTSRFSTQSAISPSTAHTSISAVVPEATYRSSSMISPLGRGPSLSGPSASQQKMAAYQAALAAAAHEAAASGKFQRSASPVPEDEAEYEDGDDDLDDNETQESTLRIQDDVEYSSPVNDHDDFGYENMDDLELDDEAIIAEANASALANDSDGWYGQEFGFFAAPSNQHHGSYSSSVSSGKEYHYANGGFFGPKGDLARSASGRLISREPTMTPITERSEYSNRNSVMSMGMPPIFSGTPTLQSSGLAQLAMMSDEGDDMTLPALLRLRSRAWGGSQASLSSSREGSPKSDRGDLSSSPWATHSAMGVAVMPGTSHVRKTSVLSSEGRESDAGSLPASPTLTLANALVPQAQASAVVATMHQSNPVRGNSAPSTYHAPRSHIGKSESAPVSAAPGRSSSEWNWPPYDVAALPPRAVSLSRHGKGHRRQKSSTDSISYIMEEEDDGQPRWIMERRRTGDGNGTELLEREIIPGGRI